MSDNLAKELARAKARVAKLEQAVARESARRLAALPAKYGFGSIGEFIAALKAADGKRKGPRAKSSAMKPADAGKKRKRAAITEEVKNHVAALVKAGKSGSAIARETGISLPSVQNVKKSLGSVRPRGSKAKPSKGEKAAGREAGRK